MNGQDTTAKTKSITAVVVKVMLNRLQVKAKTAALFDVSLTDSSVITKKNGVKIAFTDIQQTHKLKIVGLFYPDNSIGATEIQNLSIYPRVGTFSGKILSINPAAQSFILQTSAWGKHEVFTSPTTVYLQNSSSATFQTLEMGVRAKVQGVWEGSRDKVMAVKVTTKPRLISIEITGQLVIKAQDSVTVLADGTIYGVDIRSAKLFDAKNKEITLDQVPVSSRVKVTGKHLAENVAIVGSKVKLL